MVLLGNDYSSKFSPYLAFGNISGKSIQLEVFKYEKQENRKKRFNLLALLLN